MPKGKFEFDSIARLCEAVNKFSQENDLRWKGYPTITWAFGDVRDFMEARQKLLNGLPKELVASRGREQLISRDTLQLDCYGITFRLVLVKGKNV